MRPGSACRSRSQPSIRLAARLLARVGRMDHAVVAVSVRAPRRSARSRAARVASRCQSSRWRRISVISAAPCRSAIARNAAPASIACSCSGSPTSTTLAPRFSASATAPAPSAASRSCRPRRSPARRARSAARAPAPIDVRGWRSCATRCPNRLPDSRRRCPDSAAPRTV